MDKNILFSIKRNRRRVRRDPHQKVHAPLADGYRLIGLMEDALNMCRAGLEVHPSYLLCREVLGRVLFRTGHVSEAKEQLEKVHRVVKDDVELNRVLAKLYLQIEDGQSARPLLEAVLEKDPFDYEMRSLLTGLEADEEATRAKASPAPVAEPPEKKRRSLVFDLETILAQADDEPLPKKSRSSATDSILDSLENMENSFEDRAEEILVSLAADEKTRSLKIRPRLDAAKEWSPPPERRKELHGAALVAQLHFEIALLEEALQLARKLMREESDEEWEDLARRLDSVMRQKEHELDKLEE